uniref:Uncharacterized protein n=1 Tax=viral metagenome TaxID=1070528 RepID=A0A6C0H782_9ZZZZ
MRYEMTIDKKYIIYDTKINETFIALLQIDNNELQTRYIRFNKYYQYRTIFYNMGFEIVEKGEKNDMILFDSEYVNYDGLVFCHEYITHNSITKSITSNYNSFGGNIFGSSGKRVISKECKILYFWHVKEYENHKEYFRTHVWKELTERIYSPSKVIDKLNSIDGDDA